MRKHNSQTAIARGIVCTLLCTALVVAPLSASATQVTPSAGGTTVDGTTYYAMPDSEDSTNEDGSINVVDPQQEATGRTALEQMVYLTTQLETAYEDLNEISEKLVTIGEQIDELQADVDAAKLGYEEAQNRLAQWTKFRYTNGQIRYLSVLLGAKDFSDFVGRITMIDIISENAASAATRCEELKGQLDEKQAELDAQKQEQETLLISSSQAAATIDSALGEQVELFASLDEDTRNAILADTGLTFEIATKIGTDGTSSKEGAHPEVVTEAMKYLGIKYVWGGETTAGFDCSGLTMYVYQKACGISLTHFARTQYYEGVHVTKSALMPGDLVFFGTSPETIHHVGIYIGNDKFIHAPQTGDVVKISTLSARTDYVGACRPQATN